MFIHPVQYFLEPGRSLLLGLPGVMCEHQGYGDAILADAGVSSAGRAGAAPKLNAPSRPVFGGWVPPAPRGAFHPQGRSAHAVPRGAPWQVRQPGAGAPTLSSPY